MKRKTTDKNPQNYLKKVTRKLAILIALALVFTTVFSNSLIVKAADVTESSEDTTVSDNTSTDEVEVELLQNSGGWTIFRSIDETGKPNFDVSYFGQSIEELKESNLEVQYRVIRKNSSDFQLIVSEWYDINYQLPEDKINSILKNKDKYLVQFMLVDSFTDESELPKSYTMYIYPQENEAPHILSASYSINTNYYDYCEVYDLCNLTNKFHITLKLSEHLEKVGDLSVTPSTNSLDSNLVEYFSSNLSFENCSEEYTINDKNYTIEYSLISFDVELSPTIFSLNTSSKAYYFNYQFEFNGIKGINSNNVPEDLLIKVCTPTTDVSPSAKLVKSITITGEYTTIAPESYFGLTATVLPDNATDRTVTWSSSNDEYASVDSRGYIKTNNAGAGQTVTITATANDSSGVTGTYTFSITGSASTEEPDQPSNPDTPANPGEPDQPSNPDTPANPGNPEQPVDTKVSSIDLTAAYKTVQAGKKVTVNATVNPSNATNVALTWTSSNNKYATVNSEGVVTTKKAGIGKTVTITATAKDGSGKKATINIKIVKTVKATKITLTAKTKTVKAGKKVTVKATFKPTNVSSKALTWTSSNKKYATVNSKGVVTTKKAGKGKTVKITAKAKDGSGKKATIKIKIR